MKRLSFAHWETKAENHAPWEDAFSLFTGVTLVVIGVAICQHLGMVTGGVPGLALVVHYLTGLELGLVFFLLNLPFYSLAIIRMGWTFTLKTFVAVALFSVLIRYQPFVLDFSTIDPIVGAIAAGLLYGTGLLVIFRHRASMGGVGILALFLQDKFSWRAGLTQLVIDVAIILSAFTFSTAWIVLLSAGSAVLMNLSLTVNHRGDRYIAR
jgi:uncharacterized membrane-anchored protein YitT (DUF2179 family)